MNDLGQMYIKIPMKRVYVVENERGAVKIGVSQNVHSRIKVLSKQGGFKPVNLYCTDMCSNSYELEHEIHKKMDSFRIGGEWFEFTFSAAVKVVTDIFEREARFEVKKQRCVMPEDIDQLFNRA